MHSVRSLFQRGIIPCLLLILWSAIPSGATEIEILSYNVENLFDTVHDRGKNDWEFLPKGTSGKKRGCRSIENSWYRKRCLKADWTKAKLRLKLSQIEKVVRSAGKVHILALIEVENENVLSMLSARLGYGKNYVITQSPGARGMDVAVLFREFPGLRMIAAREHGYGRENPVEGPFRHILQVDFTVAKKWPLTLLVNHWPSQNNPERGRIRAAKRLKEIVRGIRAEDPGRYVVALGDFNTLCPAETRSAVHPFTSILLEGGLLKDLHPLAVAAGISPKPSGTYFYRGKWNLLDRFFVSGNLLDGRGLHVNLSSYRIFSPNFITRRVKGADGRMERIPKRYDFNAVSARRAGYSDHFAVGVRLEDSG